MSDPKQISLFENEAISSPSRHIEYVSPLPDLLDEYAEAVCTALEQGDKQTHLCNIEVMNGFAMFVKVIVRIQEKHLNRRNQLCYAEK